MDLHRYHRHPCLVYLVAATFFLGGVALPTMGLAQPGHRPGGPPGPPPGQIYRQMPPGHRPMHVGGNTYYVYKGRYYAPHPHGYMVVPPPRGPVLPWLPLGAAAILIGGLTYYTLAGVYYRPAPGGYVVVDTPTEVVTTTPAPVVVGESLAVGTTVSVVSGSLNVRTGPSYQHPVVAVVHQGVSLVVQGSMPGWLYVRLPTGQLGWVAQQFTAPMAAPSNG